MKKTINRALVVAALLISGIATAQTSSINAFSPYTMYGVGELNVPGTLQTRSMGGVGVADRNPGNTNLLNPAAYSSAPQRTFLFSFGLEGQNYYNSQTAEGAAKHSAYNTFNIHDIAIQMPLTKGLGLGLSLAPYSSVGYRTKYYHDFNDPFLGDVGPVQYTYQGEGDVTEVKLGIGWELFKNFSIGAAVLYYWGDIDRTFIMTPTSIVGEGSFGSTVGTDNYGISRLKWQVGVQYSIIRNAKRMLNVGAAFNFGGALKPDVTSQIYIADSNYTTVKDEMTQLDLVLPHSLNAGLYYRTTKWGVGLDYNYQNWGSRNGGVTNTGSDNDRKYFKVRYEDTHTIKAGVEFTPSRYDVRRFLRRWSYRLGVNYGNYNQSFSGHKLQQYAVTAGIGIPVKFFGVSSIDLGVEYGRRGYNLAESLGLVRQQYFKFAIGFSLFAGATENNDYWFTRPKFD